MNGSSHRFQPIGPAWSAPDTEENAPPGALFPTLEKIVDGEATF